MRPHVVKFIAQFVLGRSVEQVVYAYDPVRQGLGQIDPEVQCFEKAKLLPNEIKTQLKASGGWFGFHLMCWRLWRHGGLLLILMKNQILIAYGFIQSWRSLRREYSLLGKNWVCLGPYWINPQYRRQGIYIRLLQHSIAECVRRDWKDAYIWAKVQNKPSIRGIEKAGFVFKNRYRVSRYLCKLYCRFQSIE